MEKEQPILSHAKREAMGQRTRGWEEAVSAGEGGAHAPATWPWGTGFPPSDLPARTADRKPRDKELPGLKSSVLGGGGGRRVLGGKSDGVQRGVRRGTGSGRGVRVRVVGAGSTRLQGSRQVWGEQGGEAGSSGTPERLESSPPGR